jgi:hypothetical protein
MVLGIRGIAVEACRVAGVAWLLAAPLSVSSCGASSKSEAPPHGTAAKGGAGSSGASGGSSAAGGGGSSGSSAAAGGAGRAGAGGAAGGSATGGTGGGGRAGMAGASGASGGLSAGGRSGEGGAGGSSGEGGDAGGGGSGGNGPGPEPGLACQSDWCALGNRCVFCNTGEGTFPRCAPDPDVDPSGYDEAMAGCLPTGATGDYSDCDGPEDCGDSEYCAVGIDSEDFGSHCTPEAELPNPPPTRCCFSCGAPPECVLCWTDVDCPETYLCSPVEDPSGIGGCGVAD